VPAAEKGPSLFAADPVSDKAEIEFLKGSPRVALDIKTPFTRYLFIAAIQTASPNFRH
jgi:hypothetical protein